MTTSTIVQGRQSKATRGGQEFQNQVVDYLKTHPLVDTVTEEVNVNWLSRFSRCDVVATLNDGSELFVPCVKDLWLGTHQIDRLEAYYTKWDAGKFIGKRVFYCCQSDILPQLEYEPKTQNVRRRVMVRNALRELFINNKVGNLIHLGEYVESVQGSGSNK